MRTLSATHAGAERQGPYFLIAQKSVWFASEETLMARLIYGDGNAYERNGLRASDFCEWTLLDRQPMCLYVCTYADYTRPR